MSKKKFPKRIEMMIVNAYNKGWTSKKTAEYINSSRTATTIGVYYKPTSIASKFANITRM